MNKLNLDQVGGYMTEGFGNIQQDLFGNFAQAAIAAHEAMIGEIEAAKAVRDEQANQQAILNSPSL